MNRRIFLASLAALVPAQSFGAPLQGRVFSRPPGPFGPPEIAEFERPWGQVLRTFGDPVLEGHFSLRANVKLGHMCVAMWDRGDRILGINQSESEDSWELWSVIEAVLGRRPDIEIGPGSYIFSQDHYETAHWQLDDPTAERISRLQEARDPHASSWKVPSKYVAKAVRPFITTLGPPRDDVSHVLWTEPAPRVQGGPVVERKLTLGLNQEPEIEEALMASTKTDKMLVPISRAAGEAYLKKLGPLVPFTATLTNVVLPNGEYWGRFRVLSR